MLHAINSVGPLLALVIELSAGFAVILVGLWFWTCKRCNAGKHYVSAWNVAHELPDGKTVACRKHYSEYGRR